MEVIVANVEHIKFDIEIALDQQYGALPLPFPGMDKSTAAVCEFYTYGTCDKDTACPYRHIRGDRTVVCKHWLRGLCKKGDQCEFLHEYDMSKMPECYFYSRFNACHNKECPFLHIDPESKIKDCPWYDRGFCRHGPHCRHRHVRRVLCSNYVAGLCPDGPECKFVHPRFELPAAMDIPKETGRKPVCHHCGEVGHKINYCNKMTLEERQAQQKKEEEKFRALGYVKPVEIKPTAEVQQGSNPNLQTIQPQTQPRGKFPLKPLEEVTCFKCGTKGHYANKCPKGHLAFLSQNKIKFYQTENENMQNQQPNVQNIPPPNMQSLPPQIMQNPPPAIMQNPPNMHNIPPNFADHPPNIQHPPPY